MSATQHSEKDTFDEENAVEEILKPGMRLGVYEITDVLGRGGMGVVYGARHSGLGKKVAIKTLVRRFPGESETVQRFIREAQSSSIISHPHVVDVTDIDIHEGRPYMVMEYLEGENLRAIMRRRLDIEETLDIMIPVVSGLGAAHAKGIVHRDVKPTNIFLVKDPRGGPPIAKILDFGIAKVTHDGASELTRAECVVGTPQYLAPEQACPGKRLDHRCDQYSAAVVIYQCLTGNSPFAHDSLPMSLHCIVEGKYERLRTLRPDVPEKLERIIAKAMSVTADLRFANMKEFGDALLPFASKRTRFLHKAGLSIPPTLNPEVSGITTARAIPVRNSSAGSEAGSTSNTGPITRDEGHDAATVREASVAVLTKRHVPWAIIFAVVGLAIGVGAVASVLSARHPVEEPPRAAAAPTPAENEATVPTTFAFTVAVQPPVAEVFLDDRLIGLGSVEGELPIDGQVHTMRIEADGYAPRTIIFHDAFRANRVDLVRLPDDEETAPVANRETASPEVPASRPSRSHQAAVAATEEPPTVAPPTPPPVVADPPPIRTRPRDPRGTNGAPIVD